MNTNDKLVKLLQDLVKIPSWVSDDDKEKWTINENDLIDFIEWWLLKNTNLTVKRQELDFGRFNLIAFKGKPEIVFLAHVDTVGPPVNSTYPAFGGEVHDGKVWGRGSADMKSGIASLMQMAELNPDANNYAICFYADEEYDFLGMKELVKYCSNWKPKFIISADGSDLKMGNGCRGLIEIRFRIIGESAHAASGAGKNALLGVYGVITELEKYLKSKAHPDMGISSLNLAYVFGGKDMGEGKIRSVKLQRVGQEGNVVPDVAEAVIDIRPCSPDITSERVVAFLEDAVWNLVMELTVVNTRHDLGAWFTEKDDIKDLEKIACEVCGTTTIKFNNPAKGGYLDLQMFWETVGRPPALVFGSGAGVSEHTDNEYVEIEKLFKARDFFVKVLENFGS